MAIKFTDLQCKEVISLRDGQRLGFISDIQIQVPQGEVCAVVVPGPCRHLGLLGRREDFVIPWSCIRRIGPDIVLVDTQPEECRVPRHKHGLPFSPE